MNAVKGLFGSRKATVVIVLNVAVFVLYGMGKISWNDASEFVKWLDSVWMGAHAWEQGQLARAKAVVDGAKETAAQAKQLVEERTEE